MADQQKQLEIVIRGINLTIRFKEFLLTKDVHSRSIILNKCIEWFSYELSHSPNESSANCYAWFQNARNVNDEFSNEMRKETFKSHNIWGELHYNLSGNLLLQKLISFFLVDIAPSEDLR
jgi:hypothetical protein